MRFINSFLKSANFSVCKCFLKGMTSIDAVVSQQDDTFMSTSKTVEYKCSD